MQRYDLEEYYVAFGVLRHSIEEREDGEYVKAEVAERLYAQLNPLVQHFKRLLENGYQQGNVSTSFSRQSIERMIRAVDYADEN